MPRERDPFHKYVEYQKERKKNEWKCLFCGNNYCGNATRIRAHLAGILNHGIKACEKVDPHVKAEAFETFNGKGSVLDKSTGGTSGKGTEGTVFGASQNVLPSDDASNPNDMQNSNQLGCALQQPSFYRPTGTGTAPACPQDDDASNPNHTQNSNQLGCTLQQPSFYQPTGTGTAPACPQDDDASNPNHTQNSNQLGCTLQQPSFYQPTGTGTAPACPQDDDASNPNHTQNSNQLGCTLQQPSFYRPTGTGTAPACPQDQGSLPPGDMPVDNLDNTQQRGLLNPRLDAAHGNEIASSLQQLPMGSSASSCLDFSERQALHEIQTHLESETEQQNARGLSSFPNDEVRGNSMSIGEYLSLDEHIVDGITPDSLLDSTCWSDLYHSLPENLPESREAIVNTFEEIQTNELHNPTVGSSLQIDSSLDVDGANRLLDCGQPCLDEVVPVHSNTSPTDAVQHPGQLPARCDKEDGNDIRQFPSRTPMDIDPSTALQHSSDSHIFEATTVDSLVPEASTNPIGPSLSRGLVPPQRRIVPHRSINLQTAHQNPTVPSSSCENRLVTGHPQALVDMDPCMPSSSQSPNHAPRPPQILPCRTGLTRPSSLPELDMNEGVPMTSHPNTYNIFEESGALKRKREQVLSKEADIRAELKFGASLSLKKPRMEVVNWLVNVEKLRNDCLLPHQVDILMCEAEDLQGKGLFETRETKVNNLIEEKMVGKAFQRNTTKILQYLEGNKISKLGIYGMGGVGKTTIMVHIHNRLKKANYGNVIWITVSQDFKIQTLQDTIEEEIGLGKSQEKDVRKRAAILCDYLTKRGKSTIILDDVWESFDLKEVGIPIRLDEIKLVLTTRSIEVCRRMCCQEMIKIKPLSQIEAESLFLEELGSEVALNLETKAIMKSIVQECAGLPLAIITMARSMHGVADMFEWKDSLEKLRESDIRETDMEKEVLMKLEFSYNRLGNHEVQQCFLSCAFYPEDEWIDKFELIELFIDQGLIDRLNTREKQYNRGLTILNKLENVCLLEGRERFMKMHDLIRDMALNIMSATSIVQAGKWLSTIPSEEYWTDALEKVSLMKNNIEEFPLNMSPNCPKLSTFLLNGSLFDVVIPNSFFKHLQGLKVLNLSECHWVRELPDSISDLVNLRALLLRNCGKLHHIPYLGKLTSLRKLDILFCHRVEALEGLNKLVDLRYLDIHGTNIKQLPKGTSGALLNLQYVWCSFEDVDEFNKFLRVVCELRNKPRYYKITGVPKELEKFVDPIYHARLQNCELAVRIVKQSYTIVSVGRESSGSGICILIPQNLQKLLARYCDGVTNLSDMGLLENLEKLEISEWENLRVLNGREDEIINIHDSPTPTPAPPFFQSLRVLVICDCPRLRYLFGHGPKFYLPHLRKITIEGCMEMVGITAAVTPPSPHLPPAFPSLEYIYVRWCPKLKRVVESEWLPHFCKLRTIKVVSCWNMEEIIGGPPLYMPIEEISLEKLFILNCVNLRKLFSQELLIHLPKLRRINVKQCDGMVEMISGAGQGQEGSIMTSINNTPSSFQSSISLPKLNYLQLWDLPQLKSICEVPITCDSMEFLEVCECPELNRISLQLLIRDFEDPSYIQLQSEEKRKPLIWVHPNAQAILQSHPNCSISYAGASNIESILDRLEGRDE